MYPSLAGNNAIFFGASDEAECVDKVLFESALCTQSSLHFAHIAGLGGID